MYCISSFKILFNIPIATVLSADADKMISHLKAVVPTPSMFAFS